MSTLVKCTNTQLAGALLCIDGEKFNLKGREPLRAIFNSDSTDLLFMMGRQYGKSTTLATSILLDSVSKRMFNTLFVAPRGDQVSEFSSAKLSQIIKFSPRFKNKYIDRECIQNVSKKTFVNGSSIMLRSCFLSADGIRGITADRIIIDEIQDIILGNIPIIEECYSNSKYQWRSYAGTPKTLNNTLAQKWNQSTQNEWMIKCSHCGIWNIIEIENIGKEGLICKKCTKDLDHKTCTAEWVAKYKLGDPNIYLTGFRVPQVLSPNVKWGKILEKFNTYPLSKFQNEVMARPCDNAATPISETELRATCDNSRKNLIKSQLPPTGQKIFMGVDWGHGDMSLSAKKGSATGYTVVTIGAYTYNGLFQILGMYRFAGVESDPEFQVNWVYKRALELDVPVVAVDHGAGFLHNSILKRKLGYNRVLEWQASGNLRGNTKYMPEVNRMIFNRTECMTDRFVELKNKKISLFNWGEFAEFSSDFTTIFIDYRSDGTSMFYGHVTPDDAFHSLMLCKMTADYYKAQTG